MKNFQKFPKSLMSRLMLIMVVPFTISVSSCKDDDENPLPATTIAKLMVTHASPDAPGVDLLIDNVKLNPAALSFPNSTSYMPLVTGNRNVKVNVAGTSTTVIDATLPFEANKNYSVFAIDAVASISALVIEDNLATPAAGKAHIRFIHLSPDAPAVDVALDGGAVVFANKSFKGYTSFTPLDAGSYDLEVRVAGTSNVALDLDPVNLQAGKIYTVFAKGFLAGSGSQALGAQIIVNN
jgi:hypothetical protein